MYFVQRCLLQWSLSPVLSSSSLKKNIGSEMNSQEANCSNSNILLFYPTKNVNLCNDQR